jgi:hypothetical protein
VVNPHDNAIAINGLPDALDDVPDVLAAVEAIEPLGEVLHLVTTS